MEAPKLKIAKAIIVGDSSVGKSCFLLRMTDDTFRSNEEPTIGVEFGSIINQSKGYKIQVWDTAGKEAFRSITRSYYRGSHLQVLVYDITRRESFDDIESWLEEVQKHCTDGLQVLIVGCKSDLQDRQVTIEEGENKALQHHAMFFEVSNKDSTQEELKNKLFELADKYFIDNSR